MSRPAYWVGQYAREEFRITGVKPSCPYPDGSEDARSWNSGFERGQVARHNPSQGEKSARMWMSTSPRGTYAARDSVSTDEDEDE